MTERNEQIFIHIEELEGRIAPATLSFSNGGVTGSGSVTVSGGTVSGSGTLTINQTGTTLSGSFTYPI